MKVDNVEECLICVKELFSVPDTRALNREREREVEKKSMPSSVGRPVFV